MAAPDRRPSPRPAVSPPRPRWLNGPGPLAALGAGRRFHYGWAIVAACWLIHGIVYGSIAYSYSVFFVKWEAEFGWSRAFIAGALSFATLVTAALTPLVGRLVDLVGARRLVLAGGLLAGAGLVLVSRMSTGWHLYASYGVVALGYSTASLVPLTALVARWFQRRRGTAIGLSHTGMGAGGMVIVQVTRWLADDFGWRVAAVALGASLWGIVIPLALLVIRSRPEDMGLLPYGAPAPDSSATPSDASRRPGGEGGLTLRQAASTWQFWTLAVVFTLAPVASSGMYGHLLPFMTDLRFSVAVGSLAVSLAAGGHLSGKLVFGLVADRLAPRFAMTLAFSLTIVAALVFLAAALGASRAVVFGGVPFLGPGASSPTVVGPIVIAAYFGARHLGSILGVILAFTTLGFAAGPVVAGLIFDATGSYRAAFVLSLGLASLAIATAWLLRPLPVPGDSRPAEKG